MPYPNSSEVMPGQATASAHYNDLRNDALFLGQNALNAVLMGQFLAGYMDGLYLELLDTDRLRIPASAAAPACLMVNGCMLTAAENVDLPAGARPTGAAAQYHVFAVRSAGSSTFTLDVNTSASESTGRRRIGAFYWDGQRIEAASLFTVGRCAEPHSAGIPFFGGRLSLASGSPIADVTSSGTIYYTPFLSNRVSVFGRGAGWRAYPFSEISKSLEGMPASRPADVFLCNLSGTLALELEPWLSADVRAVELSQQDGVEVKSGSPGRVYLGTLAITESASISADTPARRLVWNRFNRVARPMAIDISTNSWTYSSGTYRAVQGTGEFRLDVCAGMEIDAIAVQAGVLMKSADNYNAGAGIGVNSTTINSAQIRVPHIHNAIGPALAFYSGRMSLGLKSYYQLEFGNANVTFYGTNGGGTVIRSGLASVVMA